MKKVLFAVCMLFTMALGAQTTMGSKYIGGTLGFNSTKSKADGAEALTSWSLNPELGYFIADNLALGVELSISGGSQGENSTSGFGGGVYARKFMSATDNLNFFIGANVGYSGSTDKVKVGGTTVESKENTLGAFLDLGLTYAVSEKWTIIGRLGTLGFSSVSNPDNDQDGSSSFGLNVNTFGNPFSVGMYYSF